MRKHRIGLIVLVVVGIWVLATALTLADSPQEHGRALGPEQETIPAETIPAPTPIPTVQAGDLSIQYSGGPNPLCAGWNLYYTLRLTNTNTTSALTNLVVTDTIPAGTWYNEGDMSGDLVGVYDEISNSITWQTASLGPEEGIRIELLLHSLSGQQDGTWITNTMGIAADQVMPRTDVSVGSVVDSSICPPPTATPTHTPTVTPTATITPSPTSESSERVFLPLMWHQN